MELLPLLGALSGAIATVGILSLFAGAGMNSSMNRILVAAGAYGAVVGAFVGGLIAYLALTAAYWLVLPLAAIAPAALYLLAAFSMLAVKNRFPRRFA